MCVCVCVCVRACVGGDVKVWFVARSMFLTDHRKTHPPWTTRWIAASLQRDVLDVLVCYLSPNRQLIGRLFCEVLKVRALLCHSLPWPHCVSNGWGKRRQTLTQWCLTGRGERASLLSPRWKFSLHFLSFFSLPVAPILVKKCLRLSEGLVKQSKQCYQRRRYGLFIYPYRRDVAHTIPRARWLRGCKKTKTPLQNREINCFGWVTFLTLREQGCGHICWVLFFPYGCHKNMIL